MSDTPLTLAGVVAASHAVAADRSRRGKARTLAEAVIRLAPSERRVGLAYLAGHPLQTRLGVGWRIVAASDITPASEATLLLGDVDAAFQRLATAQGPGSTTSRRTELDQLMALATADEQDFLRRLLLREVRQGALDAAMLDAVALATGIDADDIRERVMVAGDLVEVTAAVLDEGAAALSRFVLTPFQPVQPMLAQTATDVAAAMTSLNVEEVSVEVKVDGARIQVHRNGADVRVYTRNLRDVTEQVPAVVEMVRSLAVQDVVLDGEVVAIGDDQRPMPFQATMGAFSAVVDQDRPSDGQLRPYFFDVLRFDGEDLLERSARERYRRLDTLPESMRMRRLHTDDPAAATEFLSQAMADGHEGVMVKDLSAAYRAGRRGAAWLKVKPVHTLDLVVLAAEWGSGRRTGTLSNLHLGARHGDGFVMLGKTFKGLTDATLAWQTTELLARETGRSGHVVEVRPELVVEIAFDGVQRSSRYPGGVALRFARVKGYRPDREASSADTLDTVQAIHRGERLPPLPGT